MVSPDEFIPLAEESGAIVELGRWVLAQACQQLTGMLDAAPHLRPVRLNVNVSPRQFEEPDFAAEVADVLGAHGWDPDHLTLEITESMLLESSATIRTNLQALRDAGVAIAIDDFGTGYSALSNLSSLPVSELKIDRSFVHNLDGHRGVVGAIVELARTMNLTTVAEGVENEAQAVTLAEMGCTVAQGYLYARPMAADALHRRFAGAA